MTADCDHTITDAFEAPPGSGKANGVQLRPFGESIKWARGDYLVVLRGDAILAFDSTLPRMDGSVGPRALDGNHLGPGLPTRCPTGDHIEGGTFESWFTIE